MSSLVCVMVYMYIVADFAVCLTSYWRLASHIVHKMYFSTHTSYQIFSKNHLLSIKHHVKYIHSAANMVDKISKNVQDSAIPGSSHSDLSFEMNSGQDR